jgi:hypothetical protein
MIPQMKAIPLFLLALASCTFTGEMVERKNATAHIQPSERDRVIANATQVLQKEGWTLEPGGPDAGVLTTQMKETGIQECAGFLCQSRATLTVTVTPAGDVAVALHRELYSAPPGPGWFTPKLDEDVKIIEDEQKRLLRAILDVK